MTKQNVFTVSPSEKLYIDGIELKNVTKYELRRSAGEPAELTVTLNVTVNQATMDPSPFVPEDSNGKHIKNSGKCINNPN